MVDVILLALFAALMYGWAQARGVLTKLLRQKIGCLERILESDDHLIKAYEKETEARQKLVNAYEDMLHGRRCYKCGQPIQVSLATEAELELVGLDSDGPVSCTLCTVKQMAKLIQAQTIRETFFNG